MKILKSELFVYNDNSPSWEQLADFVNKFKIQQNDIQQITVCGSDGEESYTLFYWSLK